MTRFQFTREERTHLLGQALRAFIPLNLEHLPPLGNDKDGATPPVKILKGRYDRCSAAWALSTVESLEYRIANDIEYHEKRAKESREKAGAT